MSKFFKDGSGLKISGPGIAEIAKQLRKTAEARVLVGVPESGANRAAEPGQAINNAVLGYIHEFGAPEANIPARPWLVPSIRQNESKLAVAMKRATITALDPKQSANADKMLEQVGILAVGYVKSYIQAGLEPPLSERTLAGRAARGRKGAAQELENRRLGLAPSTELAKPLIDTGAFLRSINYVVDRGGK